MLSNRLAECEKSLEDSLDNVRLLTKQLSNTEEQHSKIISENTSLK